MRKYTFNDFNRDFPDDETCLEWLKDYLYPEGIFCKVCERITKHHRVKARTSYSCDYCGHHEHPMAGTIYQDTRTPLRTWFYATYLMAQTRCGISAKQIERETGVTYKTAWRMFTQIRSLMQDDDETPLTGTVEIDETFVGGKPRYRNGELAPKDEYGRTKMGKRPSSHARQKVTVVGAVERKGRIKAKVLGPDVRPTIANVSPLMNAHIMPSAMIYTDEASVYRGLEARGWAHRRVHHASKIYVDGDVHTNTIEGFWALLKNGIRGVHHAVSAKYLQEYVNEYTFRYNHRNDSEPMFQTLMGQVQKM